MSYLVFATERSNASVDKGKIKTLKLKLPGCSWQVGARLQGLINKFKIQEPVLGILSQMVKRDIFPKEIDL